MADMSRAEWNEAIDEYLVEDKKLVGRASVPPLIPISTFAFPLSHRLVTEELIRYYANSHGDPNPLWHDTAYGRTTRWGSMIAPPTLNRVIAETHYFDQPPPLLSFSLCARARLNMMVFRKSPLSSAFALY